MSSSFSEAERTVCVTPLVLRFWDSVTSSAIGRGLRVEAYAINEDAEADPILKRTMRVQRVSSFVTASGFHAFQHLSGMREVESGNLESGPSVSRRFIIEVSDALHYRFLPFSISTEVPKRGVVVELYSAASRPIPTNMAVIRAELWDAIAQKPANGAVLEVKAPGLKPGVGRADGDGRVVVILSYPEPITSMEIVSSPLSSPLESPSFVMTPARPWTHQEWVVELQAYYEPNPIEEFPDLTRTQGQKPADLWRDSLRSQPFREATMKVGQDLILRTVEADSQVPLSNLFITPSTL